ncbi:PASTA domain-containing protein [Micromonospora sp. WMMA1949]|uniref:PASTA domain-containing protein n=1 Tax=unclassified Micromonospora TaxID=2617518 RepID=UPI0022B70B9D|nr:PASTA domain-containing protein [Micromonospora sp. WMMA1949]MCZ7426508.1 PASTA domain-containing protein [Micromonospora sp. WMMA1949]
MTDERQPAGDDTGAGRARLFLGGGLAVILLAVIGASVGWILAGDPERPAVPGASAPADAASTSASASTAPPTTAAPPTGTRTSAPAGLTVPEVVGVDFEQARRDLRERRLGWRLVFGTGIGRTVERASPSPGTPVKRGTTVTVWVSGPAPAVSVPDVGSHSCSDAADDLVEAGLYPRYATGRQGPVTAQAPVAGSTAWWNDQVTITCGGQASTPPTGSPSPTP